MRDELRLFARLHVERGRVLAVRVALLARFYFRDPLRHDFLRYEIEHLSRRVVYHLRQAVLFDALVERMDRNINQGPTQRGPQQ